MSVELYRRDINSIRNDIIKKIMLNKKTNDYIDTICLDIKCTIENIDYNNAVGKDMKYIIEYSEKDLKLFAKHFFELKEYTDEMSISFDELIGSFYQLTKDYIRIKSFSNDISKFIGINYKEEETWNECFRKYLLDNINNN